MPKPGYRSLTIREETARRLESLAKEKRIGVVELVERYAAAVELIALKEAATTMAAEQKLTQLAGLLYSITHSIPEFQRLDGDRTFSVARLDEIKKVERAVFELLRRSFPGWEEHIEFPSPFISFYTGPPIIDWNHVVRKDGGPWYEEAELRKFADMQHALFQMKKESEALRCLKFIHQKILESLEITKQIIKVCRDNDLQGSLHVLVEEPLEPIATAISKVLVERSEE